MKVIVACAVLATYYVRAISLVQEGGDPAPPDPINPGMLAALEAKEAAAAAGTLLGDWDGVGLAACWIGSAVTDGSLVVN